MLLTRPLQLLAVAAGTGSILLAVLSSAAVAQRPTYRNISHAQSASHGCPCPCPAGDGAATDAAPGEGEDLPEVADLGDGGFASAPQSAVPNALGDSMGGCLTAFTVGGLSAPLCPGAGRFDISDNNSALPQHRIYYNYYYFDNALRAIAGGDTTNIDVQRHEFGFEYPFWCDMASFGVEVPFSHTVNSELDAGDLDLRDIEFGNISLYLKTILYQDCCKTFSAGLGITLPTADDISLEDGGDEIELDNDVVVLSPYLAVLVADPCSCMFFHGFVQVDLPTDEFSVDINGIGDDIDDPNVLHVDGSIGYWLCQDCCGNGIAAIAELHYQTNLDGADNIALGGNGIGLNDYDFLYATVGADIANGCWNIRPAIVLPLKDRPDREFDWEAMLQVNRRF